MPWTPKESVAHNARVKGSKKLQKLWSDTANGTLESELAQGTEQSKAEGIAVATANKAVAKKPKKLRLALAARSYAPGLKIVERQKPDGSVKRTIFSASGLVHHEDAEITPAGNLAVDFEYCHTARLSVPVGYDQLGGMDLLQPGLRAQFAFNPQNPADRQPVLYEFDSQKFTEAQARSWLNDHGSTNCTFQPDLRDKAPVTQGNPAGDDELVPEGFADLDAFYSATLPEENP